MRPNQWYLSVYCHARPLHPNPDSCCSAAKGLFNLMTISSVATGLANSKAHYLNWLNAQPERNIREINIWLAKLFFFSKTVLISPVNRAHSMKTEFAFFIVQSYIYWNGLGYHTGSSCRLTIRDSCVILNPITGHWGICKIIGEVRYRE